MGQGMTCLRQWHIGGKLEDGEVDLGLLDEMAASYKPQDKSNSCENSRTDDADLAEGGH
jgi:hypothetical protein